MRTPALILAVASSLLSCRNRPPVTGCTPNAMHCMNNRSELCVMSQRWELHTDCTTVTPGTFTCQTTEVQGRTVATCMRSAP